MIVHLLSPGDPSQRTGGYLYNARVVAGLRALGHPVHTHRVDGALPELGPGRVLVDGLLWTHLGDSGAALARERPVAVLVHSPLWREGGDSLKVREERALCHAHRVIATSDRTAADLDVDAVVVEPGTDPAPVSQASMGARWLCVATVTPRKGHDVLMAAVDGLPIQVRCAGSVHRDVAWSAEVRANAPDNVTFLGDLDAAALQDEYAAADAVVHAAHYEGWGMALAEALVRGLPVVSTPAGLLDHRDPGAWIRVHDAESMRLALTRVQGDADLRGRLRAAALGLDLPSWPQQVARLAAVLEDM